jgi:hypothetical protein
MFLSGLKIARVAIAAGALMLLTVRTADASTIFWTDWLPGDTCAGQCFTGTGTIATLTSTVGVTYSNAAGIGFYQTGAAGEQDWWIQRPTFTRNTPTSPYTSAVVDNIPTGTDIIGLQFQGAQTLTFSQTIGNPVFSFVSLNSNGYAFLNQDFNILSIGGTNGDDCGYWGCGGVTKVVIDLGGGNFLYQLNASNVGGSEPHGTIQFTGAFDTLTWTSSSNEFWNGFTVGVQGTAREVFPPPSDVVPEPGTIVLFGTGLALVVARVRRRTGR